MHGPGYFADPRNAVPENFLGVMGMPINAKGEIESENLTLAARNAALNMMTLLQERGFSREQAYVMCSVAVDVFAAIEALDRRTSGHDGIHDRSCRSVRRRGC